MRLASTPVHVTLFWGLSARHPWRTWLGGLALFRASVCLIHLSVVLYSCLHLGWPPRLGGCLVILAPKTKGLGGNFSMTFGFHRESADSVKIMVFPRENWYFSKFGLSKIDKKSWKNWCKMWCEKNCQKVTPKARKNQFLEPFWPPQTLVFLRFWL